MQKSSVRFNSGGSGSFVGPNGLVITNHHVGLDTLQKFSTEKNNYVRDGFFAKTAKDEIKATDLELNVLLSIEDVTARVNGAVKEGLPPDEANAARRSVIAGIEKESKEKTGLRSDVVTLYQGGAYHLYRYKRYDDVRLVFAPEQQAAFYGGDPDNFEYPRFDLDVCFFRAYENGQPAKPEHYLKWNAQGPADGELIFVSGHPGKTDRQLAVSELADMRDHEAPYILDMLKRREVLLTAFSSRSFENARRAKEDLFGLQNSRKVFDGIEAALLDPEIWGSIKAREEKLRASMKDAGAAFRQIEEAQAETAKILPTYRYFEQARGKASAGYRGAARDSTVCCLNTPAASCGMRRKCRSPMANAFPSFATATRSRSSWISSRLRRSMKTSSW